MAFRIPFVPAVGDDTRALDDLCNMIWRRLDDSWNLMFDANLIEPPAGH
jgi:hypothetical protein